VHVGAQDVAVVSDGLPGFTPLIAKPSKIYTFAGIVDLP
jgi:hypothetical protein